MANILELLKRNFSESDSVCVGRLDRETGKFHQEFIKLKNLSGYVGKWFKTQDVYLCYTPLTKQERKKQNACDTYLVVQDIDGVPIPQDFEPSYYWETSPDKYQGIWVLDNLLTVEEHKEYARILANAYNFDKTSSDIVHFYRLPQTINHKYRSKFNVSALKGSGKVYRKKEFIKHLDRLGIDLELQTVQDMQTDKIPYNNYNYDEIWENYGLNVFINTLDFSDRSEAIFKIENKLIADGASKEVVKYVLLNLESNLAKFTQETVDDEVHRAFAKFNPFKRDKTVQDMQTGKKSKKKKVKKKQARPHEVIVTKYNDIEPVDESSFWLVEGLWQDESVGVIGAPSKSFKSTLVLNMACAVASGEPLDGRSVKQGAVMILQGENNLGLERRKIIDITGKDDLPIYFVESFITLDKIGKLRRHIAEHEIKLLIIDPLYLLFGVGDINKHQDITSRLQELTRIRDDYGCSVILVHHSRKLDKGSKMSTSDLYGSSFIEGWYESMVLLQRNGISSSRAITYFRNHKSGDRYDLVVDDNMSIKLYPLSEDEEDTSHHKTGFPTIGKKKKKDG